MAHRVPLLNKLYWTFLITLFARCNMSGQQDIISLVSVNTDKLKSVNGVVYLNDSLFTGITYSLFENGIDTAEISSYKSGREHGTWKKYYDNGRLKEQREYADGKKTGLLLRWWESGAKQMEYFFENDEYKGTCREWNITGLLVKEMNYKSGHEEGRQKWWYDNGKIKSNYIITGGRRYGLLGTKNCINVSDSIFKK